MLSTAVSTQELYARADQACAAARRTNQEVKDIVAMAVAYAAAQRRRMDADLERPL
ncbi:MAG TPA: hypothetical protein VF113_15380 [Stellaceae bacterium]